MSITAQETQESPSTDRIEKRVEVRASRSRVWRAISTAEEFGAWFRVNLDGAFAEGATIRGNITHPGYEHVTMEMRVERMEPERYFSYRWHPYAVDPAVDYSEEHTIVESGFDQVPLGRRDEAFRMNDKGWAGQVKNLARHVE